MDPKCMAFSFYPSGSAVWVTSEAFGVLKGGEGVQLTSADTELNPTAAIYFKLPQSEDEAAEAPPPGSDGGDGNNTTVIAAVVGSVVGAALVAGAVLLVFYLRSRKVKGLVADDQKDGPAEAGHEAHVTAGSGLGGGLDDGSIELALSGPGSGGSPLGGSGSTGGESGSSTGSPANSHLMSAAGVAAAGHTHMGRTYSPPSVVDAASQPASGASAPPPEFSPFMLANPAALAAAARSRGSSSSSAYGLHQQQQHQHQQQHQQHQDAMVVEVQRASPAGGGLGLGGGSSGGGRGGLPTSMSGAGNARELLEVFARMYNQRPAVDYDVVAQVRVVPCVPVVGCTDAAALGREAWWRWRQRAERVPKIGWSDPADQAAQAALVQCQLPSLPSLLSCPQVCWSALQLPKSIGFYPTFVTAADAGPRHRPACSGRGRERR
jgi:hypothetical protein